MEGPYLIKRVQTEMNDKLLQNLKGIGERREQKEIDETQRQEKIIELLESIDRTLKEIKAGLKK